jgi:glycosyltransferase involved in cell wall biosynthesis
LEEYNRIRPAGLIPIENEKVKFFLAYVGTLGENYDLDCILTAFASFQNDFPDVGLLLLGGGEREQDLRLKISELGLRAWISGRVPYRTLIGYLKRSHVGLNCFKSGGNVAYSYKLNDYLLAGVPVINGLVGESADLVAHYDLGVNYIAEDSASLLEAMRSSRTLWIQNPTWRDKILAFSSQFLDRKIIYREIISQCLNK